LARYCVILNPIAGRGLGSRIEADVRRALENARLDHELLVSQYPGHVKQLAQSAVEKGFDVVVAVGGDGTCQEAINGMMAASHGEPTGTLGMIPVGTGSDLARGLGISKHLEEACRQLAAGKTRTIDLGLVSGPDGKSRYFGNVVGVGFDAVVLVESLGLRWLRGIVLYLIAVLRAVFITLRPARVAIQLDGEKIEKTILLFAACNGPREGGGFQVAPEAIQDDGMLDFCIGDSVPRLEILRLIPHFMRGTHVTQKAIRMSRGARASLTAQDDLVVHADGELLYTNARSLDIRIVPACLKVIV
jgi:YegS/Rv2252/BmrU family lipid kinase